MRQIWSAIKSWLFTTHGILFALGIACLGPVWFERMTPNINVVVGVAALSLGALFWAHSTCQRWSWSAVVAIAAAIGLGVFSYFFLWTFPKPPPPPKPPPRLNLEYRVHEVQKRTWIRGPRGDFKTMEVKIEFVNRSNRGMDLEVGLKYALEMQTGLHDFTGHVHWYPNAHTLIDQKTQGSGARYIRIGPHARAEGVLGFNFPSLQTPGGFFDPSWNDLTEDKVKFGIVDRISRLSITAPFAGYPPSNQRPYAEVFRIIDETSGNPVERWEGQIKETK